MKQYKCNECGVILNVDSPINLHGNRHYGELRKPCTGLWQLVKDTSPIDQLGAAQARIRELEAVISTAADGISSCWDRIFNPSGDPRENGDPQFDLGEIEGYLRKHLPNKPS